MIDLKKYKHVIWDWNGTLLNDIDLCLNIANKMLANHQDTPLDLSSYKNAFGFPITAYYEKIGIDLNKESFEDLTAKFVHLYNTGVKNCILHDGVSNLLHQFKVRNQSQYILTAAHKDTVMPLLHHFDILHYFDLVEGVDNHRAEGKVDRGVQMMQKNKLTPAETVLIGDTYHDFEVGTAMNIDCVLVADGHQSKERLLDFTGGKVVVVDKLAQLF